MAAKTAEYSLRCSEIARRSEGHNLNYKGSVITKNMLALSRPEQYSPLSTRSRQCPPPPLSLSLSLCLSHARCSKGFPRALSICNRVMVLYMYSIWATGESCPTESSYPSHAPPPTLAADRRASSTLLSLLVGMQNIGTIREIKVKKIKKHSTK